MAMEVSCESFEMVSTSSPRISFSNDLSQADLSPSTAAAGARRLDGYLPLDPAAASTEFDFSLSADFLSYDSSVADDLFSGGVLLPLPIRSSSCPMPATSTLRPNSDAPEPPNKDASISSSAERVRLQDIMDSSEGEGQNNNHHHNTTVRPRSSAAPQKSFWRFGRSSSLNCRSGSSRAGGLCSFPLLRSKSTGSSPTRTAHKSTNKQKHNNCSGIGHSPISLSTSRKISNDSNTRIYYYSGSARRSYNCNGVRIGTILNVPTPCSMNIFSYLLCSCGYKS